MIKKRIYRGLMISAAIVISTALAQEAESAAEGPPKSAIVGSWIETITVSGPGAPPPFKSVGIYTEGGSVVFSDQGGVTTNPPAAFSSGVGAWVHLKGRTFAWTIFELISDLEGHLTSIFKIRGETTLDQSGNNYTSRWLAEFFDPDGNLLFSADGTNQGQRIIVEPLP